MTNKNLTSESSDPVGQMMADYVDNNKTAGMVTLVSRRGEIIRQQSMGFQDIASQTPMRDDTIFRIYSMTKPITSVALMTLFEKDVFELDDPAERWIPALKNLRVYQSEDQYLPLQSAITIRQLLTHTAGFSYGFDPENQPVDKLYSEVWDAIKQDKILSELMDIAFELPLIAQPGTLWHYSIATDICGYLIECMTDMPFRDYLQQTIFEPLDMADTSFEIPKDKCHRFASLYGLAEDGSLKELETNRDSPFIPPADMEQINLQSGGGGLLSTISDYWTFAQMMLDQGISNSHRILQSPTVRLMTRNHLPENLKPLSFNGLFPSPVEGYGFGLGYCINQQNNDIGRVGDFGWGGMADTYCWIDPESELVGILMQQFMPSLTYPGRQDFRRAVYQSIR